MPASPSPAPKFTFSQFLPWAFFAAWLITLTVLSSLPGADFGPMPFFAADKVVHVILFAMGACPLMFAVLETRPRSALRAAIFVWIGMLAVGAGDEIHQTFTPGRSGNDLGDLTADAIGALLGIGLAFLLHGIRSRKPNPVAPVADRAA